MLSVPDLSVPDVLEPVVPFEPVRPSFEVPFGELAVGDVGSVGLPAVPAGGVVGVAESFGVPGGTVDGVVVPGIPVVPGVAEPGVVVPGCCEPDAPREVEPGEVGDVGEPAEPAPVEVCAIAALANIADASSDNRRVDLSEKLVMNDASSGKFPWQLGWHPVTNG